MKSRVVLYDDTGHPFWRFLWKFSLGCFLLGIVLSVAGFFFVKDHAPRLTESEMNTHEGHYSRIVSSDNVIVWGESHNQELLTKPSGVPSNLKKALLSIEDRDFYQEKGVNYARTVKAVLEDLAHHNRAQGGSTLTEQLVKNSLDPDNNESRSKSILRKLEEIYLARRIGKTYSKDKILTMYVNKVYMGSGLFGMRTAAKYYFNRPLNKISVSQAALLAGLVQSPTMYDPYIHPKVAKQRRNTVIKAMKSNHKINKSTEKKLVKQPIKSDMMPNSDRARKAKAFAHNQLVADDYTEASLRELDHRGVNFEKHSYQIKIPLNMRFQRKLYNIVDHDKNVPWPNKNTDTAAVVLNNKTGQPVAQIGERFKHKIGSVDQAIEGDRSTGSIIKPILDYAPAMDDLGWSTGHSIEDEPYKYPGTHTSVYDWDNQYQGDLSLTKALMNSRNIPAIKTLATVGLGRANKLMRLAGLPKQKYYANGIGASISPAEMASAYSSLANYGSRVPMSYVSNINRRKIRNRSVKVMSPQTAYMLTKILEKVPQPDELGSKAHISGANQAVKTGSVGYANGNKGRSKNAVSDIWTAGYTKQYTIIVWTGYNSPKQSLKQHDSDISEKIYKDMMQYLLDQRHVDKSDWSMPGNMESYHDDSGKQYAPKDVHKVPSPSLEKPKPKAVKHRHHHARKQHHGPKIL